MSTTNAITNSIIPAAGLSNTPANMQINQADFLRLITTQLQSQNPLSPADPTQFVTQLEGMSQVSAMQSMQTSLQSSQIMSGTTLIGRSVLAPGSQATLVTGGGIGGAVQAPAGTTKLSVTVQDSHGNTVSTFNVTPADTGLTSFVWNGKTAAGAAAASGQYTIGVNATVNGQSQKVDPMVINKVDSVLLDPTTNTVDVETESGTIPLSSIVSVM